MNDEHKDGCMVDLWNSNNISANRFVLDVCECNWYDRSVDMTAEVFCWSCETMKIRYKSSVEKWNEMARAAKELGYPKLAEMCKKLSKCIEERGDAYLKTEIEYEIKGVSDFYYAVCNTIETPCPHCTIHEDCDTCELHELHDGTGACCDQWMNIYKYLRYGVFASQDKYLYSEAINWYWGKADDPDTVIMLVDVENDYKVCEVYSLRDEEWHDAGDLGEFEEEDLFCTLAEAIEDYYKRWFWR